MRKPNTKCSLCDKPLYRRPNEMIRFRYTACLTCRSKAQKVAGITEKQMAALVMGRVKGTNHRTGYSHKPESKEKISFSNKLFYMKNPDKAKERGAKTRGEHHYKWNGGSSKLNTSIRQMTENRKWMDEVKERDGQCVRCGSKDNLESHHKVHLSELIERFGITSREDALANAEHLWDIRNGETLCRNCHYKEHGRTRLAA